MKYILFNLNDDESINSCYTTDEVATIEAGSDKIVRRDWQFPHEYLGGSKQNVLAWHSTKFNRALMLWYQIPGT